MKGKKKHQKIKINKVVQKRAVISLLLWAISITKSIIRKNNMCGWNYLPIYHHQKHSSDLNVEFGHTLLLLELQHFDLLALLIQCWHSNHISCYENPEFENKGYFHNQEAFHVQLKDNQHIYLWSLHCLLCLYGQLSHSHHPNYFPI